MLELFEEVVCKPNDKIYIMIFKTREREREREREKERVSERVRERGREGERD